MSVPGHGAAATRLGVVGVRSEEETPWDVQALSMNELECKSSNLAYRESSVRESHFDVLAVSQGGWHEHQRSLLVASLQGTGKAGAVI